MPNSFVQNFLDAEVDAISLSEFIYKPTDFMVQRRLAAPINTLNFYLNRFDNINNDYSLAITQAGTTLNKLVVDTETLIDDIAADATNTVNAAIEGVAIDANLVTDALIATTGGISQKTINNGLQDISAMTAIANPFDGMTVNVKGSQGGSFEYNSSKANINNGGTIFNGWVRITMRTDNLVDWFGAKWDGTDTTTALDKAIVDSAIQKRVLNFGGADRTYVVNTMEHVVGFQPCSFIIKDNMHLVGQGCKIIADNRAVDMPSASNDWFYRFFCYGSEVDGINLENISVNNVSIKGIDFDTQFDKFGDIKHQIGIFMQYNGVVNDVLIEHCNVYNSSSANAISCYFDYFRPEISKNWKILNCRIINSGFGGDCSPIYLMADDAEVKVDIIQRFDDIAKNLKAANAIEVHGSNQNIHHCLIHKTGGGIISGINFKSRVNNTRISNNIINSYSAGITIWNGEDVYDKGIGNVDITNNTVRVLPHLLDGRRMGIGTGNFGGNAEVINISNNTIICEDAEGATTGSTPIDVWFIGGGIGIGQVNMLNVTNNVTRGSQGISIKSDVNNFNFRDVLIKDNNVDISHQVGTDTIKAIRMKNSPASNTLNNRSVVMIDNRVTTSVPANTTCYEVAGNTGNLTIRNHGHITAKKYSIVDKPAAYVDSESYKEFEDRNIYTSLVSDGKIKFTLNLAAYRAAGGYSGVFLSTIPADVVVKTATIKQVTAVTGATNVTISLGSQAANDKYLLAASMTASGTGTRIGVLKTQRGIELQNVDGHYRPTAENLFMTILGDSLSGLTGIIDVVVTYADVE